jgi:flagellar hook protein FlgE
MSFNTALSGLRAANADLSVTGNNVANAGTVGFKTSRAEFGDVYSSTLLGGTANSPGSGVNLQTIRQLFSEGPTRHTNRELDLAIGGEGFFVVKNGGEQLYTRAGAFGLDKEGYVVSGNNSVLQGYPANANGVISGIMGDLRIDVTTQAPRQTTLLSGTYNLDSRQLVLESTGKSFSTEGAAIAVSQNGLKEATTTTVAMNGLTLPIDFAANPSSFDLILSGSQPASGNGTTSVSINSSVANSLNDVASLINSAIYSSATPLNVQAVVNSATNTLELRDLTTGINSVINVDGASGVFNNPGPSTAGIPAVDNGYLPQALQIMGPTGATVTFNSEKGASAAKTASELNSMAGITASARTDAKVLSTTFDNSNSNLMLNGVRLSATTMEGLANEINALTTSNLPGISASLDVDGNINLVSNIGTDLKFSFVDTGNGATAGTVEVVGRVGTGAQLLNDFTNAAVVGGKIDIVMGQGYSVETSNPAVGNIMAPLTAATFTDVPINAFDPKNQNTYNEATSAVVYDSLGNPHSMRQYFVKQPYDPADPSTTANHWIMYVQVDGQNVGDPDPTLLPPQNTEPTMASFNVHFNQDGSLNAALTDTILISNWMPLGADGEAVGALGPLNVLQGGTLPVNEPPSSSNFEIKLDGSTQFGSKFDTGNPQQNGYSTGRLAGLDVGKDGIIFARFTNGEAQVLGQVALANFNSLDGLKPVGGTMWAQTYESGDPGIGVPGAGTLGDISSGTLEESNVDLSEQLVNLIIAQRNFQASAKTIETTNATTQTIINLR